MLQALSRASLEDDVSGTDTTTNELQTFIAQLTGKPAGLFVLSGTMGNIVSLRSLLSQPPYAVLCDSRAHILNSESGGAFVFTGAIPQAVQATNGKYLTLEDIIPHIKIDDGKQIHSAATRVISLENTLNGMVMPLQETRRICEYAHKHSILVHLDGARLWEAVTSGEAGGLLSEYGALFDTITLCFAKGLGASAGAVIVGNEDVIRRARWIKQSIGGGIRQPGPLCGAARVAVERTFCGGLLRRTHEVARDIATFWQESGGKLRYPTETNMIWLDFEGLSFSLQDLVDEAAKRGVLVSRPRLVVHYREFFFLLTVHLS
ncbi:pyridoxal phosphate-dependent transferase [Talaromyces proteolyticus]|uniref:Pyridoxal phosphate-dependent transferase n=1 Tax=Talaromyces proteolyticus TaxID=1131652 RepID=A0AAD4KFF1_9EURO|nr:pyridoxal phosphate-dependent transferase [Talaromyces proteolyticus]KAH8689680.1 pyridoxal phosphate-dependent transferase [Talaromyces proteolyticus]